MDAISQRKPNFGLLGHIVEAANDLAFEQRAREPEVSQRSFGIAVCVLSNTVGGIQILRQFRSTQVSHSNPSSNCQIERICPLGDTY